MRPSKLYYKLFLGYVLGVGILLPAVPPSLLADDLRWAEQVLEPPEQAPAGLRNNISLEMINAFEGLLQPRFQHYFRDSLAYYIQLQFGTHLASGMNFTEEYQGLSYKRLQLGFELGLSSLLYARNSKVTKDIRRWGSGMIAGFGFRSMLSKLSGGVEETIFGLGLITELGWQLQSRNFSVTMYLELRIMLQIGLRDSGALARDMPIILDRGPLSRALPSIPLVNDSLASPFGPNVFYGLSQTLNVRVSYYF